MDTQSRTSLDSSPHQELAMMPHGLWIPLHYVLEENLLKLSALKKENDVAHVVGNMEDEGLNIQKDWILYSISLPRASYFLAVPPEDCRGNIVGLDGAQEKSMKQKGRGQGTTFERIT